MKLAKICTAAGIDCGHDAIAASEATVTGFAIDHRKVARGTVFGAFRGARVNGEDFIADAIGVVFQCTIDTMYLCSFKDIDEYGGKHMSSDMRDAFGLGAVEGEAEREATPIQTAEDFKEHSKRAKTPNLQPGPSV